MPVVSSVASFEAASQVASVEGTLQDMVAAPSVASFEAVSQVASSEAALQDMLAASSVASFEGASQVASVWVRSPRYGGGFVGGTFCDRFTSGIF